MSRLEELKRQQLEIKQAIKDEKKNIKQGEKQQKKKLIDEIKKEHKEEIKYIRKYGKRPEKKEEAPRKTETRQQIQEDKRQEVEELIEEGLPQQDAREIVEQEHTNTLKDQLILNQEEASYLTKISFHDEVEIFKKIDEMCPGVAVMTKGGEGVIVSDGKYMYMAKPNPERKIVDTTGAGDSFSAGFMSDYIRYNGDIEKGIQLGLANSEACLSEVGAKNGLLDKNSKFERVQVVKQLCSENNLCITK